MLTFTSRFPQSRFLGRSEMGSWDRCDEREVDVSAHMYLQLRKSLLCFHRKNL